MAKKNKIHISKKTRLVCDELVKTIYEWEVESKRLKQFDYSKAKTKADTLDEVCAELRKTLEGEVRIRGGV